MRLRPFRLERFFAEHEFTAPHLLCASDCESVELGELLDLEPGAEDELSALRLGYTDARGGETLRRAIAELYERVTADGILVHAGAEEAIFNFMNVALEPGDHLVVHSPCYQSLAEVARGVGAEIAEWRGDPAAGWELDPDRLESALTPRTRVVVINFPHNPSGFLASPELQRRVAELASRHGFLVFSDEVYRGLEHDPADRLPAFADLDDRAVSLGVMSKTYGLAGLRIGWIATRNRRLLAELAAFKDYTTICCSAPSEYLAALALRQRRPIVERNLRIIRSNLERLDRFFAAHARRFVWERPKAGPIAFPAVVEGSADELCRDLLREAGVLLLPGSVYGNEPERFRIGFGRRGMTVALERFDRYLRSSAVGRS